jgi:hypothetical protein
MDGFTITSGDGTSGSGYGGGVAVSDTATPSTANLTCTDCLITANDATYGGGLAVSDHGKVTLSGSKVYSNTATYGGGLAALDSATVSFSTTQVKTNDASSYGGGVYVTTASVTCTGDTSSTDYGIYDNTAPSGNTGGGLWMNELLTGTFIATSCDFGTGTLDNSPNDVGGAGGADDNSVGNNQTFTCVGSSSTACP